MPASRMFLGLIPWYSVLVVSGMALAILLASREEKRLALPTDTALDLALRVLPCGILGARLYYVIFTWQRFATQPLRILYVWEGGLAIYGGLIGGIAALLLFARRRKLPVPLLLDMVSPGVALAQAVGRWGNFFNMEAYGAAVTVPRWQRFPFAVLISEGGTAVWHQATFFYESLWDFLVFLALWRTRKGARRGDSFLRYSLLYGAGRLVIEGLRTDSLYLAAGLRVSQLVAARAVTAVLLLLLRRQTQGRSLALRVGANAALLLLMALCLLLPGAPLAKSLAFSACGIALSLALGLFQKETR